MIESVGTIFQELNIMGLGIMILVVAIVFGIARGLTRNSEDIKINIILFGITFMVTLFRWNEQKSLLLILIIVVSLVYTLNFIRGKSHDD